MPAKLHHQIPWCSDSAMARCSRLLRVHQKQRDAAERRRCQASTQGKMFLGSKLASLSTQVNVDWPSQATCSVRTTSTTTTTGNQLVVHNVDYNDVSAEFCNIKIDDVWK